MASLRALLPWFQTARGRSFILRVLLLAAIIGFFVYIRRTGDFAGYLLVGNLVLDGRNIYLDSPPGINTWPPFFSLLCVPLALLARPTPFLARGVWVLLNYGFLLLTLHLVSRLVYGQNLSLRGRTGGLSLAHAELLLPLLLTYYYVTSNFEHLQINILIFCLTLLGLVLQSAGRDFKAGMAIGFAAAVKIMPVLFIPYLVYRRRFRAAAYSTVWAALFSLSPILVYGWRRFLEYALTWRRVLETGWGVGKMNQSVFAMWDRLLGHGMLPLLTAGQNGLVKTDAGLVTAVWYGTLAVVVLAALFTFRGRIRQDSREAVVEWCVVFIVVALFGPVAWKAYLVVLLLPNALLYKVWGSAGLDRKTRRISGAILLSSFALGGPSSREIVGKSLSGRLEMSSCITLAALIVLAGMFWLRGRLLRTDGTMGI